MTCLCVSITLFKSFSTGLRQPPPTHHPSGCLMWERKMWLINSRPSHAHIYKQTCPSYINCRAKGTNEARYNEKPVHAEWAEISLLVWVTGGIITRILFFTFPVPVLSVKSKIFLGWYAVVIWLRQGRWSLLGLESSRVDLCEVWLWRTRCIDLYFWKAINSRLLRSSHW